MKRVIEPGLTGRGAPAQCEGNLDIKRLLWPGPHWRAGPVRCARGLLLPARLFSRGLTSNFRSRYYVTMKTDIRHAWFSIADAVELAGVKSPTLKGWLDRQLVLPAGRTGGRGRGVRLFDYRDLVRLRVGAVLTDAGVRAEVALRFAAEVVDSAMDGRHRFGVLIPSAYGFEFAAVQQAEDLTNIITPFGRPAPQSCVIINLVSAVQEVSSRAKSYLEAGD